MSGGVLDQPAGLLKKMNAVMNVYNAFMMHKINGDKPGEMAKWRNENQDAWAIISEINELRANYE